MISTKAARNILNNVAFPGENDPTYSFCLSRTKRKNAVLLKGNHWDVAAAIQIQSAWRGHRTRRKLRAIFSQRQPSVVIAVGSSGAVSSEQSFDRKKSPGCLYPNVKPRYKEYIHWCNEQGLDLQSSAVLSFADYCARIIQSWWRRLVGHNLTQAGNAVPSIASVLSEGHSSIRKEMNTQEAAVVIQRAWRKHNDMKVFKFYKDLINFRGRGDPKMMLHCINPAEAKLLDRATGAHIKFRLGGVNFPPNIYYKVFTHQPIVDLCAYSPRDYTALSYKQKLPRDLHNHGHRDCPDDKDNWYKRYENNGWRPVSDRFFLSRNLDSVTVETSNKEKDFHHSKLKRKEDLERKRKQKKIEWLRKMYKEGILQARKDLSAATSSAVQLAADQLVELSDTHGTEVVEDDDVDELLSWTNALNFDEYVADWHVAASTAFSDDCSSGSPGLQDPYAVTLTEVPKPT